MIVVKILPHPLDPLDPLGVVKGQIFKFRNNSSCKYFFTEILHADRGTIDMKHINRILNSTFSEHGHAAYQIKGNDDAATCKHIFCPYTHPLPLRWGSNVKKF